MFTAGYRDWAKSCLPAAWFLLVILFSSFHQLNYVIFLIWLQVPIYLLHEFEEHVFPGGFKDFINGMLFKSKTPDFPLNSAGVFWINIPFIWIMFPLFAVLAQQYSPSLGVVLPCFALFNATTHIISGLVKRRYNPGLLVSVVLNYPTGIYTLYIMNQAGFADAAIIWAGFGFALLGHVAMAGSIITLYKRGQKAKA
jgi:hypothetical protein